ncbi:hypothetical protein HELRODRAFT_184949 [Helobdella robusta]|uniref:KICSTOR subunit 2 n=1 Tax=Helobdella robusta TaxID=6412 RepID=T1FM73_HELRO|nr:hypothetical protein HELRODRAFT_184949 [Helobdella robusta]ESO06705.1 hypothetical protein HELRODRAFT_184949 [Helobdella robusta]
MTSTTDLEEEKSFVVDCFLHLSRFSHDKLKELTLKEKEKERSKYHANLLWSSFLNLLLTFNDLEKTFYSLVFLGSANFGARLLLGKRDDTLNARYRCLLSELRKIEFAHKGSISPPDPNKTVSFSGKSQSDPSFCVDADVLKKCTTLEQLAGIVCEQLQHFVLARMNTISFYEQMPALNNNKNVSVDDLLKTISTTLEELLSKVNHPVVEKLRSTYKMECETVVNLLKTQLNLQKCQYLDSLLSLQSASHNLNTWSNMLTPREARRSTFGSNVQKPASSELFDWLNRFKNLLLSKFTLYFFEVLSQQSGSPSEVKTFLAKTFFDFYNRIIAFTKRSDACSILLISSGQLEQVLACKKLGYNLPCKSIIIPYDADKNVDKVGQNVGIKSPEQPVVVSQVMLKSSSAADFHRNNIVLFAYPHDKSAERHYCHINNMLNTRKQDLDQQDRIIYAIDVKQQCTSVMTKVEGSIYLVVLLNRKYMKPDTHITNFCTSLCTDLRCSKHFTGIKSGAK